MAEVARHAGLLKVHGPYCLFCGACKACIDAKIRPLKRCDIRPQGHVWKDVDVKEPTDA